MLDLSREGAMRHFFMLEHISVPVAMCDTLSHTSCLGQRCAGFINFTASWLFQQYSYNNVWKRLRGEVPDNHHTFLAADCSRMAIFHSIPPACSQGARWAKIFPLSTRPASATAPPSTNDRTHWSNHRSIAHPVHRLNDLLQFYWCAAHAMSYMEIYTT